MAEIGYTMLCEQTPARQLVDDAVTAERVGFDYAVVSDHYFPWLEELGHSPYAWSVLGATAQATERLPLMTYVTCPIMRYHPAVVAQKAATMGVLSEGRFTLGLGAGENLNEHVVGQGWPPVNIRHEMFREPSRSSRCCSKATTGTSGVSSSTSTRPSCTTCRSGRCPWRSRPRAPSPGDRCGVRRRPRGDRPGRPAGRGVRRLGR